MASQFVLTYHFSSTRADGDDYTRTLAVEAKNLKSAELQARLRGFTEFGERFTENCFDWTVSPREGD